MRGNDAGRADPTSLNCRKISFPRSKILHNSYSKRRNFVLHSYGVPLHPQYRNIITPSSYPYKLSKDKSAQASPIPVMAYPQDSYHHTTFADGSFISKRRQVVYQETLLYQLKVLKETGRYDAFKLQWHPSYDDEPDVWPVPNHLFWDSDVAKWIEGACYFLTWRKNDKIDAAVKELVEMIRSAQQPDGYLNIHFTVVAPEKRFTNVRDLHEL